MRTSATAIEQGLGSASSADINDALRQFTQLSRDAGQLSTLASRQTDRELSLLRDETESARRRILWQSALLVPVTIGLMLLFTMFLARPIRQHRRRDQQHRPRPARRTRRACRARPTCAHSADSSNGCACASARSPRSATGSCATCRTSSRRRSRTSAKAPNCCSKARSAASNGEQREVAGILRENSLRLQRLIENLLSYSEWQARRGGLDVSEIRLQPLVTTAIETYQLPISAHRLHARPAGGRRHAQRGPRQAEADPRQPDLERGEVHARRRHHHRARTPRRQATS